MNLPAYEHEASTVSAMTMTMQRALKYHPQSAPAHFDQKKYF